MKLGGQHHALGRLKTGEMNKTERIYDEVLKQRLMFGDILWYRFEAIKLRLADNTFYNSDFAVLPKDGVLELHEVKAMWSTGKAGFADDSKVKLKVASDQYPIRFILAVYDRKLGWTYQEY
jgi:hypothetical protein